MQFAAEQARRFDLNSKGERSKHGLGSIITIGAKHTGEPENLKLVSDSRKILVIPKEERNRGGLVSSDRFGLPGRRAHQAPVDHLIRCCDASPMSSSDGVIELRVVTKV